MVFLYTNNNRNLAQQEDEQHSNLFGCVFKGLGREGRKKCREENREEREERKAAKLAQKEADAELTKAAAGALGETSDSGSDYTPFIIGGVLLLVLVGGFFLIKKTVKK